MYLMQTISNIEKRLNITFYLILMSECCYAPHYRNCNIYARLTLN